MKRKQIMALVMSGILTFGAVSPVLAADIPESAAVTSTAGTDPAPADASLQGVSGSAAETQEVPEQSAPVQELPDQGTSDQNAPVQDGTDQVTVPPADTSPADGSAAEKSGQIGTGISAKAANSLVSDAMIQSMSDNLTALLQQVIDKYQAMTVPEKEALDQINGGHIDVQTEIGKLKEQVKFDALKNLVAVSSDANEANSILNNFDENMIGQVNDWNNTLESARKYVSDYNQYLQEGIGVAVKKLQTIMQTKHELYKEEFLAKLQVYYDKIVEIEVGVTDSREIINLINEVNAFIADRDKYLSKGVLEDGKRAAASFAAFVNSAPDPSIAGTTFNYGEGMTMTYLEIADYVDAYADYLLNHFNYSELLNYYDFYYLNLVNAYQSVSDAILKSAADEIAEAIYAGYAGNEKNTYEAALQNYKDIFASKNYTALPDSVKKLGNAAKAYAQAAEDHIKAEGNTKLPAFKDQLTAIQTDISSHGEYYNDTYPAEVDAVLQQLSSADVNHMTARQIMDLLKNAEAVLAKRASSYSQKLSDTAADASRLAAGANAWWGFLPDQMKGNTPYAEAIGLTNRLTDALKAADGIYDIDSLTAAYHAFTGDFALADGNIQSAAKATAQYVLENARSVYEKEAGKYHSDGVLKALEDAIGQLASSLASWDYNKTREDTAVVKAAEIKLVNDRPQQKVEKAKQEKAVSKKVQRSAVQTGDTTDPASAGVLGLFSLTAAAAVFGIRRRR